MRKAMTITLPSRDNFKFDEITDEMVVEWIQEAELEDRRTHVLYEDVFGDPENVLEYEHSRRFAMIHRRD